MIAPLLPQDDEVVVTESGGRRRLPLVRGAEGHPEGRLLAWLGARAVLTVRLVAERQAIPLRRVGVRLRRAKGGKAEGRAPAVDMALILEGPLDERQRACLRACAQRDPLYRRIEPGADLSHHPRWS